ncbi:hypothetical protein P5673_019925 [Acropora cervicornis]|uniref:Uncharacterized protein n=1 Tax=Acropora cervicornis TaxID=6130 RepID=A0AAD9QAW0_ACRCE|nr:hypothetical protein P5673_019925 [Acropora cervicornis]
MESTIQEERKDNISKLKVLMTQAKCLTTTAKGRATAVLIAIAVSAVAILSVYAAGKFDSNPDLPELMEGEATFTSDDGQEETFHVVIDYNKKLIQLTSFHNPELLSPLPGRRLMSLEENKMENGTIINATKIQRKYFIVPENGNSTENIEGNVTHSLFQVDNDTDILLHLPNGSLHMRSKEQEMNFTDYKHLSCYRYIEENDTIEESFYDSNDSKLYQETSKTHHKWFEEDLRAMPSNITVLRNETGSLYNDNETMARQQPLTSRRKRGLGRRDGSIDWWYANWCGAKQGGYTKYPKKSCNSLCYTTTSYVNQRCREPTFKNENHGQMHLGKLLASAAVHFNRCTRCIIHVTKYNGRGPWWCQPVGNPCKCDNPFVWKAYRNIYSCPSWSCKWNAYQVFVTFFNFLSCWFPKRLCFPWIKFVCRCFWCLCPRITIYWKCITFKMCAFFGSG